MNKVSKAKKEETKAAEEVKQEPTQEEKLQLQLDEKNDQMLRLAAEYDNFRKRSQREKESIYSDVKANVLGDLLPVIDNFERALNETSSDAESYKKGVEMIFNQLIDVMKKHSVEAYGEIGEEFDPNFHNAVMHIEDENLGENVISQVFSKGYKVGDKVIRPATVQVAN